MKITLTIIFIFCEFLSIYSQDLKKITNRKKNLHTIEVFYVLKSDKSIKHGEYIKKTTKRKFLKKGYYKYNKKDSLWITFALNGVDTLRIKRFSNNEPTGRWIYYDEKGNIRLIYDFTIGDVIEFNWFERPNRFLILKDNQWVEDEIDSPPLLLVDNTGSIYAKNFRYPTKAMKNRISGRILVSFTVDETGKMSNIKLKEGIDAEMDAEAVRVVKLMKTVWFPAKKNGHAITVEYYWPFTFTYGNE